MGRAIARPWPARWPTGLAVRLGALSRLDALALAAVCVPAAMVRLPNLAAIPVFTDEAEEIGLGLAILRDGLRPLTDVDPYIGPLWNYLLAGVFWLVSPSLVVPRVLMLVAGTVTVGFAYALGRTLHGRAVGALGAALLAASPVHIGVNSHVAWSNCLTPLFTTPALWLTALAVRDARPRLLAPAGLLFGLALHTHPSSAPILAGAALAVTATSGWMLRGRWPYVATLAGVAMNANLVVYNLLSGGRSFTYAQEIQQDYVREVGRSVGYAERFGDLIVGLLRALGGAVDTRAGVTQYLRDPLVLAAAALTLAGLVLAIRKRTWLPIVVFAATILLLPLANPKYEPILNGRYLAPILPLVLLWIGLALASLAGPARGPHPLALRSALVPSPKLGEGGRGWGLARPSTAGLARLAVAAGLFVALVIGPLSALSRYYDDVRANGRTGERVLQTIRSAEEAGLPAWPVILDQRLDKVTLGPGAGLVMRVLRTGLELRGIPVRDVWLGYQRPEEAREGQLVVLASRQKPQFTEQAVAELGLRSPSGGPPQVQGQASLYGMYRFGPAP